MSGGLTLQDMVDDGTLLSMERQLAMDEALGEGWHVWIDLERTRLEVTGPNPFVATAQLLGSAAPGPGTWLWAWANPAMPEQATDLARWLRSLGEQHAVRELTSPELVFDSEDVWIRLAVASTAAAPTMGLYLPVPVGGGMTAVMLFDHPALALREPHPARILRIITESAGQGGRWIRDHRRAVESWARAHGWRIEATPTGFDLRAGRVTASYETDALGRVTGVSARTD